MLLGGILTSGLSWRWVLFVNVPIGLLCAFLAPRVLPESREEGPQRTFEATTVAIFSPPYLRAN